MRAELAAFDAAAALEQVAAAGLAVVCRHDDAYPARLLDDPPRPRRSTSCPRAAWTASRRSSATRSRGRRRWRSSAPAGRRPTASSSPATLGRGLAAAGVTVVSGMALGVDSAAHDGALEGGGATVAVLAGGADAPYPRSKRALHARIAAAGAVVAELPPGTRARRWALPGAQPHDRRARRR